jgi:hypothetical protein
MDITTKALIDILSDNDNLLLLYFLLMEKVLRKITLKLQ